MVPPTAAFSPNSVRRDRRIERERLAPDADIAVRRPVYLDLLSESKDVSLDVTIDGDARRKNNQIAVHIAVDANALARGD
jgi:hypothetical protein